MSLARLALPGILAQQQTTVGTESTIVSGRGNGLWRWDGNSYKTCGLWTHGTRQYAAFVNSDNTYSIGQRTHGSDNWVTYDLDDDASYDWSTAVSDAHNIVAVATDSDGYVHTVGNNHDNALRYLRSDNPHDITAWSDPGTMVLHADENSVAYPTFIRCADGTLLFMYRQGSSGAGDTIINSYDTGTQTWSRACQLHEGGSDRNAYWNTVAVDQDTGRIHIFWTWREASLVGGGAWPGNENIMYAYSDDNGSTWRKMSDDSAFSLPITQASAEIVKTVASSTKIINQSGACVDTDGNPHSVWRWDDGSGSQIWHFWHNGTSWQTEQLTSHTNTVTSADPVQLARPAIVSFADGTLWVLGRDSLNGSGSPLTYTDVTTPGAPGSPTTIYAFGETLHRWEPIYDANALADRDELHVFPVRCRDSSTLFGPIPAFTLGRIDPTSDLPVYMTDPDFPVLAKRLFWAGGRTVQHDPPASGANANWPSENGDRELSNTGSSRPTYSPSVAALNSKPAFTFNGTTQWLARTWTAIPQPFTVLIVLDITSSSSGSRVFESDNVTPRPLIFRNGTKWAFHGGSATVTSTTTDVTNAPHAILGEFNGASSKLLVDEVEVAAGSIGTTGFGSVRLCNNYTGTSNLMGANFAVFAVVEGVMSAGDKTAWWEWVSSEYGI